MSCSTEVSGRQGQQIVDERFQELDALARFRRLARDCERWSETLVGLYFVAFAILLTHRFVIFMVQNA